VSYRRERGRRRCLCLSALAAMGVRSLFGEGLKADFPEAALFRGQKGVADFFRACLRRFLRIDSSARKAAWLRPRAMPNTSREGKGKADTGTVRRALRPNGQAVRPVTFTLTGGTQNATAGARSGSVPATAWLASALQWKMLAGRWSSSSWNRSRSFRHSAGSGQRTAEQHFDLRIDAAELIVGPPGKCVMYCGVDSQEHLFAVLGHE
jgi:hypothetical protein